MNISQPEGDGWVITRIGPPNSTVKPFMVDIWPLNDLKQHYLGDECWCNAKVKFVDGCPVITHNSKDLREKPEAPRFFQS